MPFPWKNQQSSRISQMVNNHLQNSQLVIRNGEILKMLSMKNRPKPMKIPPENPNQNNNRRILPTPSFTPSSSLCSSPSRSSLRSSTRDSNEVNVGDNENSGERQVVCANRVVVAIFKIFLVVVLALGTKKFTVGITISAFLLILIECIGKYTRITLKPCLDSLKGLRFIVQRIKRVLRFKQDYSNADKTNKDCFKNCEPKPTTSFQETRVIKPDCHVTHVKFKPEEEIKNEQISRKLGYLESDSRKVVAEEEDNAKSEPFFELKMRISRKEKIKSKMKKLVPKKLLSRKDEYNSGSSEMSSTREDTIPSCEEQEETEKSEDEKAKQIMGKYSNEGKLGYRAMQSKKVVEEEEPVYEDLKRRKKSKKHKIKSKMKKLVPKKLLGSKKQEIASGSSEFHSLGYDDTTTCDEDESENEKNRSKLL